MYMYLMKMNKYWILFLDWNYTVVYTRNFTSAKSINWRIYLSQSFINRGKEIEYGCDI